MNNTEIKNRLKKSSLHFIEYVWPIIKDAIGGGDITPVEGVTEYEFSKELDTTAGIDAWQTFYNQHGMKCIRAIASRVQWDNNSWPDYPFNTFTIRYELVSGNFTEYHKRLFALEHNNSGILYPSVTIQSFLGFDGPPVYSVAAIYTKDLFHAIKNYPHNPKNVNGGNKMLVYSWDDLKSFGYNLSIYINPEKRTYFNFGL